jgi:predicted acyl esterase
MDNGIPSSIAVVYSASAVVDAPRLATGLPRGQLPSFPFGPGIMTGQQHAYEQDFWLERKWADQAADIVRSGIPGLIYVGWQEGGHIGGLDLYGQLQNAYFGRDPYGPMPEAGRTTGRYQLFIGDGGHGCCLGDQGVQILWFDHWLKGRKTGVDDKTTTPLHLEEIGSGRYVNLKSYPLTRDYTALRLGDATLGETAPADGADTLQWAPGQSTTYTSEPMADGATIAGPISLTVHASSTNTNLQLVATLFDVPAEGEPVEITHGSLLGSLSHLDTKRSWTNDDGIVMRPYPVFDEDVHRPAGEVVRYDVALQPKLYSLEPGHRLQLTLSTQGSPEACVATGGVGPSPLGCFHTLPQLQTLPGGTYEIQRTSTHPTALNVPLLPYRSYRSVPSEPTPTGTEAVPKEW